MQRRFTWRLICVSASLFVLLAGLSPCVAEEPLRVTYLERPPYYHTVQGKPAGFLNDITAEILARAGIEASFTGLPTKRILDEIMVAGLAACSVGWFKTPEREAAARFSLPLWRDPPYAALMRAEAAARFGERSSLAALFGDAGLRLGVLDGFSYGDPIDARIAAEARDVYRMTGSQRQLARMLAEGRVDYMLIAPVEIAALLESSGLASGDFTAVALDDVPPGPTRHLICGRGVSVGVMERIDQAIRELHPDVEPTP